MPECVFKRNGNIRCPDEPGLELRVMMNNPGQDARFVSLSFVTSDMNCGSMKDLVDERGGLVWKEEEKNVSLNMLPKPP